MIQRIAAATVLHGDGGCEAFYNGERDRLVEAVKAEMERQKAEVDEQLRIERDRADIKEARLNHALAENLKRMTARKRRSPVQRAIRAIESAWAMVWAICHCWREIGEALGLWEAEGDDRI